jgi:DNA-nicking Smr family endonuclease
MKRPSSTSIPELPARPRRKRDLSEEERALWESVAKHTKPLQKQHRAAKPETASPDTEARVAAKPSTLPRPLPPASLPRAPKPAAPPLAPLGRRERSQLSRGRKEIEARLDLHGMTFVLVITGKGKMGAESERGVLRRQVPQWLSQPEFRALVVGFEEAHIGHGGEGALYVRIRRSRI